MTKACPTCQHRVCDEDDDPYRITWKWLPTLSRRWKMTLNTMFVLAVLVESLSGWLQVEKSFRTKSTEDLSKWGIIVLLLTNTVWLVASVLALRSYSVMTSAVLYIAFSITLLVAMSMYGDPDKDTQTEPQTTHSKLWALKTVTTTPQNVANHA